MLKKAQDRAFSLIELILVIAIIGILSVIGTVSFSKSSDKALAKEAIANLKLIAAAERIYRMETDTGIYINCNCNSTANCNNAAGCNTRLRLNLNPTQWSYVVTGAPASAVMRATRGSLTYTICSSNFDAEPTPGTACP